MTGGAIPPPHELFGSDPLPMTGLVLKIASPLPFWRSCTRGNTLKLTCSFYRHLKGHFCDKRCFLGCLL